MWMLRVPVDHRLLWSMMESVQRRLRRSQGGPMEPGEAIAA